MTITVYIVQQQADGGFIYPTSHNHTATSSTGIVQSMQTPTVRTTLAPFVTCNGAKAAPALCALGPLLRAHAGAVAKCSDHTPRTHFFH
jgi:hypothetical protein